MKRTLVSVALGFLALTISASTRADAPRCEHRALIGWAAKFPGSGRIAVERSADHTRWLDAGTGEALLDVRCDGVELPIARLPKVDGARARPSVLADGLVTLARTGRDAVSLDIGEGGLGRAAVHVLAFDDGSFSVADGRGKAVYAAHVSADGTLVVTESLALGCGCERTFTPDGRVVERKLPR